MRYCHFGDMPGGPDIAHQSLHPQELGLSSPLPLPSPKFGRGEGLGVGQVTLDGKVLPGNQIPLLDDGRQHLQRDLPHHARDDQQGAAEPVAGKG